MIVEVTVRVLPDDGADQTVIAVASSAETVPQVADFEENVLRTIAKMTELSERASSSVAEQMKAHVEVWKGAATAPPAGRSRPLGRRP